MSGILGVYSVDCKSVVDESILGSIGLQHRAARDGGSGLCYDDGARFRLIRERGTRASDLISMEKLNQLREVGYGSAIAHNLYEKQQSLQPTFAPGENQNIVMGMDGTLLGFDSPSDAILKMKFSRNLDEFSEGGSDFPSCVYHASEKLMNELDGRGSYNAVMLVRNKGGVSMVAIRDPKGIKPLCIGTIEDGRKYVVASESKALDMIGANLLGDVTPGTSTVIDRKGIHESDVLLERKHAHCDFEWIYFASPISTIEGRNVYLVRKELGAKLARRYGNGHGDMILASPDSGRGCAIGYQQELFKMNVEKILAAVEGMGSVAEVMDYLQQNLNGAMVPFEEAIEKNQGAPRTFLIEDDAARRWASLYKFSINQAVVSGHDPDVAEDSVVRGTVFRYGISDKAKARGAGKVSGIVSCPPLRCPCIKDPRGKDFAAQGIDGPIEEVGRQIAANIGVDRVCYPTHAELREAVGINDTCDACFTGNYPISTEFLD